MTDKLGVKPGNVTVPALTFAGTFDGHMMTGDQRGHTHSGLHLTNYFTRNGAPMSAGQLALNQDAAGRLIGAGVNRAMTVRLLEQDSRSGVFKADVEIYGNSKTSTFFPFGTTINQAKDYIRDAWSDYCHFGTGAHGGKEADIYRQMKAKFGLNWVGLAKIGTQRIWVGSAQSGSVVTAFPAVNNKFG
ncbi:hypothetical protein EU803_06280 [Loktanella sp. IMCC34160]|uniref:hypothetical protein n=1 Tax=Loktanella sp. IMCC34160 TaxID=2510646 RepID=UPI00101B8CC7|nr:hypothetical protein [Loktanella sp. IMCC34160]RYG92051.1 hypothetical protein EU803_06280 [Loktanella sp. IMCC34160]